MHRATVLFALLFGATLPLLADVVEKRDGAHVEGKVSSQYIVVETADGERVTVPMDQITRLTVGSAAAQPAASDNEATAATPASDAELAAALFAREPSLSALKKLAADPRTLVQRLAVERMAKVEGDDALLALLKLANSPDPGMQDAAIRAIEERNDPAAMGPLVVILARTQREERERPLLAAAPEPIRPRLEDFYAQKKSVVDTLERTLTRLRNTRAKTEKEIRRGK